MLMERRQFIRTSCSLCIAFGSASLAEALSSCASIPVYETSVQGDVVAVPLSIFSEGNIHIVRASGILYDIAVEKDTAGNYSALLLRCTHASNPLIFTGEGFRCPVHGSGFDLEGDVTHGPAVLSLEKLSTKISGQNIIIQAS